MSQNSENPAITTKNTPAIVADKLCRYYSVSQTPFSPRIQLKALDEISFTLQENRTLAVVGESGCGKTTLARLLTQIEPPTSGNLTIGGLNAVGAKGEILKTLRRTVQMVFQDPYGSLNPRKNVGSLLQEPLVINTDMPKAERQEAAREMMARVGLRPEQYSRYPHMFSGGQRQRIAIARALMLRPHVVVADEPVSALDVSIQAQILNLMMDLQDEFRLAYLFVSHDLSVVRHIADEVMVMYLGRAVEHGPKDRIFENPQHPYTRALLASTPRVNPQERTQAAMIEGELPSPLAPPPGCAFHRRCPHAQPVCEQERPEPTRLDDSQVACHFAGEI